MVCYFHGGKIGFVSRNVGIKFRVPRAVLFERIIKFYFLPKSFFFGYMSILVIQKLIPMFFLLIMFYLLTQYIDFCNKKIVVPKNFIRIGLPELHKRFRIDPPKLFIRFRIVPPQVTHSIWFH